MDFNKFEDVGINGDEKEKKGTNRRKMRRPPPPKKRLYMNYILLNWLTTNDNY